MKVNRHAKIIELINKYHIELICYGKLTRVNLQIY